MSQLFPASGQPAGQKKHVTAPRGRPSEKNMSQLRAAGPAKKKTCHSSGLRPRRPKAVTRFISHEKSRRHDFSNGSGGPASDPLLPRIVILRFYDFGTTKSQRGHFGTENRFDVKYRKCHSSALVKSLVESCDFTKEEEI